MARALGHTIEWAPQLTGFASGMVHPITCAILLAPCNYRPRVQLTIAHEMIEHYLPSKLDLRWHEAACQRGAAALLMPREQFIASAVSAQLRLPDLCRAWPHASREAVLSRVADLFPGTVASSWRRSEPKFRRAHSNHRPTRELLDLEAFVAAEAAWYREPSEIVAGGFIARAWPAGEDRALSLCVAA